MSTTTKITLLILVAISIYIVYGYVRTKKYIAIGNTLADNAIAYEQHPSNPTLRILTIGDSSVVGTGADSPEHSVAGYLGKEYPNTDITNLGVNGSKVNDLIARFDTVKDKRFDLIIIQIGGNDIVRFTSLKDFEKDLATVLEKASELSDTVISYHGGNVGTAGLFPYGSRWIFAFRTWQIRNIYTAVTKQNSVHYIDLWRNKENDPFAAEMRTYYADDLFHPSNEGYRDWFGFVQKKLDEIDFE